MLNMEVMFKELEKQMMYLLVCLFQKETSTAESELPLKRRILYKPMNELEKAALKKARKDEELMSNTLTLSVCPL